MKKVLIIGGGVSGLSAGIYLQSSGYETEIIEKNHVTGGACIGWERKGCYIDGCIHWLAGVSPKSDLHTLWRETHAIKEDTEIYFQKELSHFNFRDGNEFTLWTDLDEMEKELIEFAPEDTKEIKKLCKLIKRFQRIDPPSKKPADLMNLGELLKVGFTMVGDYYWVCKTSKISCREYAQRFKNKYLRSTIEDFMESDYNFMSFLYMMGHITAKDGGIPIGGSLAMVKRMEERYLSLGGKIKTHASVNHVIVENDVAKGVELENGEKMYSDWVVSTVPVEHCLKKLLQGKYRVKKIDLRLDDMETYPIYTFTTVVLKCSQDLSDLPLSIKVPLDYPAVIDRDYSHISFRNYSYDKTIKIPEHSSVVQATLSGDDNMYFWWKDKQENGTYEQEKERIANEFLGILKKNFPKMKYDFEIIDVITPCTYERYLNSRHGCFQGFIHTAKGKSLMQKGFVKGLKKFILAGQWLIQSGGLPTAVMTGRFSAQRICKADRKRFVAPAY